MKDFIIGSGIIGGIIGIVLLIVARLGVCKDCPYASDHYKEEKEKNR